MEVTQPIDERRVADVIRTACKAAGDAYVARRIAAGEPDFTPEEVSALVAYVQAEVSRVTCETGVADREVVLVNVQRDEKERILRFGVQTRPNRTVPELSTVAQFVIESLLTGRDNVLKIYHTPEDGRRSITATTDFGGRYGEADTLLDAFVNLVDDVLAYGAAVVPPKSVGLRQGLAADKLDDLLMRGFTMTAHRSQDDRIVICFLDDDSHVLTEHEGDGRFLAVVQAAVDAFTSRVAETFKALDPSSKKK